MIDEEGFAFGFTSFTKINELLQAEINYERGMYSYASTYRTIA